VIAAAIIGALPVMSAASAANANDSGVETSEWTRPLLARMANLSFSVEPGDPPASETKPLTIATDRPGFGDSTSIAPLRHLQLETGYTFTFRSRDGVETQTHNGPEALARIGLMDDRLELRLGTSGYVWSRSDNAAGGGFESVEGFSDIYAGFKLKLIDQDGLVPRLAFEAITTVGTGSRSVSNRDLEPTIKLIGSWDLGSSFTLTSNAVAIYATASGERFVQGAGSVSLSYAATDSLSVFAEYFVIGPRSKGTDAAHSVDFGGAYLLNNRVQIDARMGFGLNQEADNVFVGVGISFLF
jgi:hypothetical protein